MAHPWMNQGTGASSGASFQGVLDDYTTGLWGAYSVSRKLLTTYSGALIRVRRSSDSTEQDINPLANGELDVASLLSFCGAGNGFITKVYDQLDIADLVQATAGTQPQIVASGVLCVNDLDLPAMQGASKRVANTFASTMTLPITVYSNSVPTTAAAFELLWGIEGSNRWFGKTSTNRIYAENGRMTTFTVSAVNYVFCYCYGGFGLDQLYIDGVNRYASGPSNALSGATSNGIAWGAMYSGSNPWNGKMTDLVVYNAVHDGTTITEISAALALS